MMSCRYQYCITGAINNIFSDGNHMNDNHTTAHPSSLLAATAAAAYPWIQCVYSN